MLKFNNIHKNQTWAFIDGVLCGMYIGATLAYGYIKLYESKALPSLEEVFDNDDQSPTD
jgi:hypothetical protein